MECCKRLLTELAKPEDGRDPVVPQALWSSALVAYARCFGKGKRLGLTSEDVSGLPLEGEVMKYHKWLLEERNRTVNHAAICNLIRRKNAERHARRRHGVGSTSAG